MHNPQELKKILAQPPFQTGIHAEFWDVPAIRDVVKIMFDMEYQSDSSYQLLLRLCGLSFKLPDPFDEHRNEKAITRRMTEVKTQVKSLLDQGWEVYTADEARPEHEAWTRRMQPPKGQRTRPSVDRQRTSQPFFGALPPTSRTVTPYPTEQNRNTEQTILALERLQRETGTGKLAVVPDNARFHHAKALTALYEPGRLLERITPIHLPPYAPDHNPVEHVWNAARNNIANIQRETPEETFGASASHIASRTFDYDFEHPHPAKPETILFHDSQRLRTGWSLRWITSELDWSVPVISREVRRDSTTACDHRPSGAVLHGSRQHDPTFTFIRGPFRFTDQLDRVRKSMLPRRSRRLRGSSVLRTARTGPTRRPIAHIVKAGTARSAPERSSATARPPPRPGPWTVHPFLAKVMALNLPVCSLMPISVGKRSTELAP